ncbi:hypothetical protein F4825DRAFT_51573 [Nemania diffusa]|nr:hypothetical protein F4825DRAFT_51573 [Nemania diffusa]
MLSRKRFAVAALVVVACSFTLLTLSTRGYLPDDILLDGIPRWPQKPAESASSLASKINETSETNDTNKTNTTNTSNDTSKSVSPVPLEYYSIPGEGETCSRFSPTYFEDFHAHAASYCDSGSQAELTCFHRPSGFGRKTDSFCYAKGAVLNVQQQKFHLNCGLRMFSEQEQADGLLPFNKLPAYWYETGPAYVFSLAISVGKGVSRRGETSDQPDVPQLVEEVTSSARPPKTILLLKREGEGNPWHSIIEIFSTYMTFDILRMPRGGVPGEEGSPLFRHPDDSDDTQIVILDDRPDGPYFDLWTLFARRKPVRFSELLADQSAAESLTSVNLIVPLAGSSNPFWKEDDQAEQCINSPILNVFSDRILNFYGVENTPFRRPDKSIVVTFVKRRDSRRLKNQDALFAELGRRNPHISLQMVDFAAVPFSEQVRIARETDILVGAHGAGLTHLMFMRQNDGAVVEIQPKGLDHHGYKNVAGMRGLGYFRVHAKIIPLEEGGIEGVENNMRTMKRNRQVKLRGTSEREIDQDSQEMFVVSTKTLGRREEWHLKDLEIEESRLFEVVDAAIKFMYNKGPWSFDVTD